MSNLDLTDTMPIGKYKSHKIEDILHTDPGYLVWLRQARKDQNQDAKFFSPVMSALLDNEITKSKQLRSKFKVWGIGIDTEPARVAAPIPEALREQAYQGGWGAF